MTLFFSYQLVTPAPHTHARTCFLLHSASQWINVHALNALDTVTINKHILAARKEYTGFIFLLAVDNLVTSWEETKHFSFNPILTKVNLEGCMHVIHQTYK